MWDLEDRFQSVDSGYFCLFFDIFNFIVVVVKNSGHVGLVVVVNFDGFVVVVVVVLIVTSIVVVVAVVIVVVFVVSYM